MKLPTLSSEVGNFCLLLGEVWSHQHHGRQCQRYTAHDLNHQLAHGFMLRHAARHAEGASDSGEHCDEDFENLFPVGFHVGLSF